MPYSIETKDGIVIDGIPDNLPKDAPELKQRVNAERQRRRMRSPEFQEKVRAQEAADRAEYDPAKGMSWAGKALANLGAGFDQAITGVRQLSTDIFGSDEDSARARAEVAEKRALNTKLADSTTGGGVLQFAGEVAPSLLLPGGAVAANTGKLGLAAAGAGAGMLSGAITPLAGDEGRGTNMAFQGSVGAALPLALGALGNVINSTIRPQKRAARAVQEGIVDPTMNAAERRAVLQQTQQALAADVAQRARQRAGNAVAPGAQAGAAVADDIPLSVAARLQDPNLARLERGSRTRNAANWYDFDLGRARAVADKVREATAEGAELGSRRTTRSANWDANWGKIEGAADLTRFADEMGRLPDELEQLALSPSASNPSVRSAIDYVRGELDRLGDNITPAHIQQMRAQLNGKPNMLAANNPLKQVPRDVPATRELMGRLDTLLDDVTGGQFTGRVNAGYAADSRLVDASHGANKVRDRYWEIDPDNFSLGRINGTGADLDVPAVTEFNLNSALNSAKKDGRSMLSDPAKQQLEAVLDALRRQNITQRIAKSATAGGGSNTASDTVAAKAAGAAADAVATAAGVPAGGTSLVRSIWRGVTDGASAKSEKLLADALQDPEKMQKLLNKASTRQGGALTLEESEIINALRRLTGRQNP